MISCSALAVVLRLATSVLGRSAIGVEGRNCRAPDQPPAKLIEVVGAGRERRAGQLREVDGDRAVQGQAAGGEGDLVGGARADFQVERGMPPPVPKRERRAGAGEREGADRAVDQVDRALVGGRSRWPR